VPARAQLPEADRARQQRQELERLRSERDELQRRLEQLQGSVHDLSEEATYLDRQADATARVVRSLDVQLLAITSDVDDETTRLVRAEDELLAKRAVLQHRLVDIYKRGPLYSYEALLSAESFGALVARYKYLHLLALRDRALVGRVEQLRNQVKKQRSSLVMLQDEIGRNRSEKSSEEERLRSLEEQRQHSIQLAQKSAKQTESRLAQLARAEARLSSVIATAEATRRRVESRANAAAPSVSTLNTRDLGRLDWPVDGDILYKFGRVIAPNNTTTRWNGVGISAAAGTPVKVIAPGEVVMADAIGTYGLTVIVQHGAGDYSIYGSLAHTAVRKGERVARGQVIGTVGTGDPDLGPHLHLEIRRAKGGAVDPLDWLRSAAR
jgi:septal ring factor EnvC (AmiA/AmiB activator)